MAALWENDLFRHNREYREDEEDEKDEENKSTRKICTYTRSILSLLFQQQRQYTTSMNSMAAAGGSSTMPASNGYLRNIKNNDNKEEMLGGKHTLCAFIGFCFHPIPEAPIPCPYQPRHHGAAFAGGRCRRTGMPRTPIGIQ